jgi:hypothetical protein
LTDIAPSALFVVTALAFAAEKVASDVPAATIVTVITTLVLTVGTVPIVHRPVAAATVVLDFGFVFDPSPALIGVEIFYVLSKPLPLLKPVQGIGVEELFGDNARALEIGGVGTVESLTKSHLKAKSLIGGA